MAEYWSKAWNEIENGRGPRWKAGEEIRNYELHEKLLEQADAESGRDSFQLSGKSIFVPLSGDCPFVSLAAARGARSVVAVDIVEVALNRLREAAARSVAQLEFHEKAREHSKSESNDVYTTIHEAAAGGTTIRTIRTDILSNSMNFINGLEKVDLIYDKDSFGAIEPSQRANYIAMLMRQPLSNDCLLLLEGALRRSVEHRNQGPPFHLSLELVTQFFAQHFVVLSHVVDLYPKANPDWQTVTYLLRKR
jgi:hypothetical protein